MTGQVLHHRLYIARPAATLDFYQRCLGMRLLAEKTEGTAMHYVLGFAGQAALAGRLELIYDPARAAPIVCEQPDHGEGYWKFSLAVADLDMAVASLQAQGVSVSTPEQFLDIGYLAFCKDPEGTASSLLRSISSTTSRPPVRSGDYLDPEAIP